jgi:hypothetical protein
MALPEERGFEIMNRSDDFVPRPPSEDRIMIPTAWGPMEAWKARALAIAETQTHLRADEAPDRWQEPPATVRNGGDCCGDGEQDCSDGDERREEDCHDDTSSSGIEKVEGLLGRGDEDIDEAEEGEVAPVYTRADMNRVASAVEGVAERVGDLLEEHRELRQIVKDQQAQIEALVAALRARERDEDLTDGDVPGEDVSSEELEASAEDLPPMLN